MAEVSIRDLAFMSGSIVTIVGSWLAVKYQGIMNAREIETITKSNAKQWVEINDSRHDIADIKERIVLAIDMESVEKKFVTKELFELTIKQFYVDLKQTKGIAQNTLDAVQNLTSDLRK